jgi:hypothetical protein
MDATALIDRYCAVWNEPDAVQRHALLAAVWGDGASYTDPSVFAGAGAALLAHIAAVRVQRPGAQVQRTSAVDVHHGVARFAWHVALPDGSTLPEGLDIALLSTDGTRIDRIVGFFGPLRR